MESINPAAQPPNQKSFPLFPENASSSNQKTKSSPAGVTQKRDKSNAEKLNAHGIGRAKKSRGKKFREQEQVEETVARDQPA
jgi:hypothetical protein